MCHGLPPRFGALPPRSPRARGCRSSSVGPWPWRSTCSPATANTTVLHWKGGDVDLEHEVLSVTRAYNVRSKTIESTKTADTRRFAIEPSLVPLLQAMHEEAGGKGPVLRWRSGHKTRELRRRLKVAEVDRPELHDEKSRPARRSRGTTSARPA